MRCVFYIGTQYIYSETIWNSWQHNENFKFQVEWYLVSLAGTATFKPTPLSQYLLSSHFFMVVLSVDLLGSSNAVSRSSIDICMASLEDTTDRLTRLSTAVTEDSVCREIKILLDRNNNIR